jgi:hypothetical protein
MPLPRKKDDGTNGAPVLKILQAHVKLFDVEEYTEPYTVTRKSDGAEFQLDPGFKCVVKVIDDGRDGADNGETFFEQFKYKNTKKDKTGEWINQENSKLGALTKVVKPGYFEDETIQALAAEDLEGFEMVCQIKPKKNPNTGQILGSVIDWETMEALRKKPVTLVPDAEEDAEDADEADFEEIPF